MKPIPVGYSPILPVFMLVAGTFMLGVGLFLGAYMQLLLGAMNVGLGVAFLSQPIFVLTATEIQVRNLFGMTLKRHPYASLADLEVRASSVVRRSDDSKLVSRSMVCKSDDWARVVTAIQNAA